jgi:3-dehydroquinate synthase
MKQITVNSSAGPYAVYCGRGLLAHVGALLGPLGAISSVFALSSHRVWKHWGSKLEASLKHHGHRDTILFDDAESKKTLATVEGICRRLARAGADRRSLLVALGGGVVGDVAGFVAACYARGVRIVHVPSTLVAQVDSSVGGKTGVNLPEGKNLVGAFYPPALVVTDTNLLKTLPEREFRAGLFEVIKYGIIRDVALFRLLERRLANLLRQHPASVNWVVERCVRVKAEYVSLDEREAGLRRALNFGHTVGHALEAVARYRGLLHGEAVGWGMIAAAWLSVERGLLKPEIANRISRLVARAGPLPELPRITPEKLVEFMQADKKTVAGSLHFVLARDIGDVDTFGDIPRDMVMRVISNLRRYLADAVR